MSKTNRFRFIKKTDEIQKHRGDRIDDGLVRISYQFEKIQEEPIRINYWNYIDDFYKTPNVKFYPDHSGAGSYFNLNSTYNDSCGSTYRCGCTVDSCCYVNDSSPKADEGITVKGSDVNQDYCYGSIGTLERQSYTIVLHLLGVTNSRKAVSKPITINTKHKCKTCGRKNKSFNKYCYNCGTYLE